MPKKSMKKGRRGGGRRRLQVGPMAHAALAGTAYVGGKFAKWAYKRYQDRKNQDRRVSQQLIKLNKPVNRAKYGETYQKPHSVVLGKSMKPLNMFRDKLFNTLYPPRLFQYNETRRLDVESGKQNILTYSFTTTNYLEDPSIKIRDLLSNSFTFANPNPTETSGNTSDLQGNKVEWNKVYLNFSSCLSTIYNSSTTTAEFDIYVYMAKVGSGTIVGASLDTRNNTPAATWNRAESAVSDNYNDAQGFATVADSINTVGYKPTAKPYAYIMNRYWRLVDKSSMVLSPGESHRHYIRHQAPRVMRQEDFNSYTNIQGVTYYIMIVAKGQLVTTNTASNTNITTGPCQLSIGVVAKNQFRVVPLQQSNTLLVSDFGQFTDAQVEVINQDTGAKAGYADDA